ncbi:MotE family protein [Rhodobacter lacus]|uniref:MotE family protein n=1 Tax=Rhodobacter lacus TaxID=1641972 RepID=A0ABW5A497_9RHOB
MKPAKAAPASPAPKPPAKAAARKIRRRLGRGSLVLIATLFATSGMIRFGSGIAEAFATGSESSQEAAPPAAGAECVTEPGVLMMLQEVQAREKKLAEREKLLTDRSQAIGMAEKRIEQRLASLVEAEQNLSKTVTIADEAADQDVARLVTVYENMKPKEAAPLFSAMAPDFAAGFLTRMRPDASAAVMAALDPQVAYSISVIMAGRNAGAPQK